MAPITGKTMTYCSQCGQKLVKSIPAGDDRQRYVCSQCGEIHYQNPKMVVGCIPEKDDRILLCRRAIDPCYGLWTLPAGYLENGESVIQGTEREVEEEAGIDIGPLVPFALYSIKHISQIYLIFRAPITSARIAPGSESLEAALFAENDIPWDRLAFEVVRQTLVRYFEERPEGRFPFYVGEIDRPLHQFI